MSQPTEDTDLQQDLVRLLDEHLHRMLKDGVPLTDKDGRAVVDAAGRAVMRPLKPSELNVIASRVRQVKGSGQQPPAKGGINGIIDELRAAGKFPAHRNQNRMQFPFEGTAPKPSPPAPTPAPREAV